MHKSYGEVTLIAALIFAAICMNLSWTHTLHDADSLMMSLISIERYLPFYWGDNRYGMLVPWLAQWVDDYRWNMLFQAQVHALAAVALVVILNIWIFRRSVAIAALSLAIALPLFRPDARVVLPHLMGAPYHTSMVLGLTAVALLLRVRGNLVLRFFAAAVLLWLALWVNYSNVFLIAGLVLLLPDERASWRLRLTGVLLTFAALISVRWFAAGYPQLGQAELVTPAVAWKSTLNLIYMTFMHVLYPVRLALFCIAAAIAAVVTWRRDVFKRVFSWNEGLVVFGLAAAFAIAITSTDWVVKNLWEPRYWTMPVTLAVLVFASGLATFIHDLLGRRQAIISAAALVFVSLSVFGVPSTSRALAGIDQSARVRWKEVQGLGCTHMIGFFSQAWSSYFYARAHDLPRPRYSLGPRAEVLPDDWRKIPLKDRVYCGICGDPANLVSQVNFGLGHLHTIDTMGELCRYSHFPQ